MGVRPNQMHELADDASPALVVMPARVVMPVLMVKAAVMRVIVLVRMLVARLLQRVARGCMHVVVAAVTSVGVRVSHNAQDARPGQAPEALVPGGVPDDSWTNQI
jgi:hypothetical protein